MSSDAQVVVLLGGPGAGKGTQAERLSAALSIPHVSTGDLFRENLKAETPLGLLARGFMERGELVPDEVTVAMARERLSRPDCALGAILDGFPRTVSQAQALEDLLSDLATTVSVVPYIRVPRHVLLERLAGRWTCRACGAMYHQLFSRPQVTGRCDRCGGELYQRADDAPETQSRRIEVYFAQTAPLIEFYRERGLLVEVDGIAGIEQVQAALLDVIRTARSPRAETA
ncbi:MAG TPA: adenylate kinase [Anaerolineae bacterium]|nr:adenylate kinase [Anaerolineae bacterium]